MHIDNRRTPPYNPAKPMPIPTNQPTVVDELKRLIRASKRPLTEIARVSGVPYDPLYKWVTGRQPHYNLLAGEQVYYALTGRTFLKSFKATR